MVYFCTLHTTTQGYSSYVDPSSSRFILLNQPLPIGFLSSFSFRDETLIAQERNLSSCIFVNEIEPSGPHVVHTNIWIETIPFCNNY